MSGPRARHLAARLGEEIETATSSMSKATEEDSAGRPSRSSDRSRRQFHPTSLWWEDLGLMAAQCLPGPTDLNTIDHAVVNGVAEIEVTGQRDVTNRQGPITCLGIERVGSVPGPHLRREGPAPGSSRLTRRMFRGMTVLRGGRRMSGLLLPLIISIITVPVLFISGIGWSYLV